MPNSHRLGFILLVLLLLGSCGNKLEPESADKHMFTVDNAKKHQSALSAEHEDQPFKASFFWWKDHHVQRLFTVSENSKAVDQILETVEASRTALNKHFAQATLPLRLPYAGMLGTCSFLGRCGKVAAIGTQMQAPRCLELAQAKAVLAAHSCLQPLQEVQTLECQTLQNAVTELTTNGCLQKLTQFKSLGCHADPTRAGCAELLADVQSCMGLEAFQDFKRLETHIPRCQALAPKVANCQALPEFGLFITLLPNKATCETLFSALTAEVMQQKRLATPPAQAVVLNYAQACQTEATTDPFKSLLNALQKIMQARFAPYFSSACAPLAQIQAHSDNMAEAIESDYDLESREAGTVLKFKAGSREVEELKLTFGPRGNLATYSIDTGEIEKAVFKKNNKLEFRILSPAAMGPVSCDYIDASLEKTPFLGTHRYTGSIKCYQGGIKTRDGNMRFDFFVK